MAFMEQSSYLFAGDSYDTPPDAPKSVWYRLLLKNRWYFYVNNFGIFCRTGRCGRRSSARTAISSASTAVRITRITTT